MRSLIMSGFILLSFSMAGCQLHQIKGEVGGVNVEATSNDSPVKNGGEFCPPGQAKKGNC